MPGVGAFPSAFLSGGERVGWLVKKRVREENQPCQSEESMLLETARSLQKQNNTRKYIPLVNAAKSSTFVILINRNIFIRAVD